MHNSFQTNILKVGFQMLWEDMLGFSHHLLICALLPLLPIRCPFSTQQSWTHIKSPFAAFFLHESLWWCPMELRRKSTLLYVVPWSSLCHFSKLILYNATFSLCLLLGIATIRDFMATMGWYWAQYFNGSSQTSFQTNFSYFSILNKQTNKQNSPGRCGSMGWVLACEPKGRWFDS